jgi:hypothetical protein
LVAHMRIFVFGSNLEGVHGKGSALTARHSHGAEVGVGVGRTGQSYAIPTKRTWRWGDELELGEINGYVQGFLDYARKHPELMFDIVAIGTGNAGFTDEQIAPLFHGAPGNCNFLKLTWRQILAPRK